MREGGAGRQAREVWKGGQAVKLTNATAIDTEWLRAMTLAVVPSGVTRYDAVFRQSVRGGGNGLAKPWARAILVKVDCGDQYPHKRGAHGAYLGWTVYTVYELAVYLTAHELRHLWQAKHPKGCRVWGSRGQYSERDASAYGIQMVRRYRRGELACGLGRMARVPTSAEKAAQCDVCGDMLTGSQPADGEHCYSIEASGHHCSGHYRPAPPPVEKTCETCARLNCAECDTYCDDDYSSWRPKPPADTERSDKRMADGGCYEPRTVSVYIGDLTRIADALERIAVALEQQMTPPTTISKEERARLKALCDAATPGPWDCHIDHPSACGEYLSVDGADGAIVMHAAMWTDDGEAGTITAPKLCDAAFIAAARTAMPALLADVKRLEGYLADARNLVRFGTKPELSAAIARWAKETSK
jgi:hypothetical protein